MAQQLVNDITSVIHGREPRPEADYYLPPEQAGFPDLTDPGLENPMGFKPAAVGPDEELPADGLQGKTMVVLRKKHVQNENLVEKLIVKFGRSIPVLRVRSSGLFESGFGLLSLEEE